jgi:hypothetical protein
MDVKEIKCLFQWWEKHESMLTTMAFFAYEILGIMGSKIETKKTFSLVDTLVNLRICCL